MTAVDYANLLVSIGAVELRTDPATWFTWASGERAAVLIKVEQPVEMTGA